MAGEVLVGGLSFPTSVTRSPDGDLYVAESGLPLGGARPGGRVSRLVDGTLEVVAEGFAPPVNGVTWHDGALYVTEAGAGRLVRVDAHGNREPIISGLPGPGDYHANTTVFGPDGKLYFSQGAMTNLGIIGLDALQLAWLGRIPDAHDIPGYDVVLAGVNAETDDPRTTGAGRALTGAFKPFGTPCVPGERVAADLPCTAAVMRCDPDGSRLELVAWGLRNAFGLGFLPDGRLLAIDQGADDRGSRPVGDAPDLLVEIRHGAWYGWPDYIGEDPITDPGYRPERGDPPSFVLADHDRLPPPQPPLVRFPPHTAATRFCVLPEESRWPGDLVVTMFGDEAPMTAPPTGQQGRSLVRVDLQDRTLHVLAAPVLHRPIDVMWDADQQALLVVDFGRFEMTDTGADAEPCSGAIWRLPLEEDTG